MPPDAQAHAFRARGKTNRLTACNGTRQQQRVAIARALVNKPTLVLADEPIGAVDSQTSGELVALIRKLNREQGVTFVVVTHDMDLSARTDRVIRLSDGRVVADESTDDRLAHAATFNRPQELAAQ